jgi:hypothetical protein
VRLHFRMTTRQGTRIYTPTYRLATVVPYSPGIGEIPQFLDITSWGEPWRYVAAPALTVGIGLSAVSWGRAGVNPKVV